MMRHDLGLDSLHKRPPRLPPRAHAKAKVQRKHAHLKREERP